MAITLQNVNEGEIYGVRSSLPVGFQTNNVAEYLETINVDLKIWNGNKTTAKPSTATYSISLDTNLFGSTLAYYEFDISELVREYLNTDDFSYPSTYASDWAAFVEVDWNATNDTSASFSGTEEFICTNGFRPYEQSTLPLPSYYTPATVYIADGQSYFITALDREVPAGTRTVDEITVEYDDGSSSTLSFGAVGNTTADLFKTLEITIPTNATTGTCSFLLSSSEVATFQVKKVCSDKYNAKQIGYVNRIGVVDYIFGVARNQETQQAARNIYKPVLNANYDNGNAQYRVLNANGKRTLEVNTGWVVEETRERISDLILTEYAFLGGGGSGEGEVKSLTPEDAEQVLKQDNNELSNYTLRFSYAYDHINSIR